MNSSKPYIESQLPILYCSECFNFSPIFFSGSVKAKLVKPVRVFIRTGYGNSFSIAKFIQYPMPIGTSGFVNTTSVNDFIFHLFTPFVNMLHHVRCVVKCSVVFVSFVAFVVHRSALWYFATSLAVPNQYTENKGV